MTRTTLLTALLCCSVAEPAFAQSKGDDEAPLPYDDVDPDEAAPRTKKKSRRSERLRQEDEEQAERDERLASSDDANIGVGGELTAGLILLEASRGGVDPRFSFGLRFVWEWGRLFSDELLREMFFADVQWRFAVSTDGTAQVSSWSSNHVFTVAPAIVWPLSKVFGLYAQGGIGVNATFSGIKIDMAEVQLQGARFVVQYGIGMRGRPAVTDDETIRLTWRVELTRYLRGYLHDTYLGAAVGLIF